MNKNEQRRIWNENHGYKGKSRKWAYRRSKRAIRALRHASVFQGAIMDLIPEAQLALPRGSR
jgi:hypothetical protein